MHSSTVLDVDDIHLTDARTHSRCTSNELCPDYTPRDRIAFVCDASAHGPLHVGRTVLALTAAFYAPLRAQDTPFCTLGAGPKAVCAGIVGEAYNYYRKVKLCN